MSLCSGGVGRRAYPVGILGVDAVSVAVAYSSRLVNHSYTGPLIRVRRASDNVEQDFGPVGSGFYSQTEVDLFLGGSAGCRSKWYDQSGNGRDLLQATAALQPSEATTTNIPGIRNLPAMQGSSAAGTYMMALFSTIAQPLSFAVVAAVTGGGTSRVVFDSALTSPCLFRQSASGASVDIVAPNGLSIGAGDSNAHQWGLVFNNAGSLGVTDGVSSVSGTAGANGLTSGINVGANRQNLQSIDGFVWEIIGYSADKTSGLPALYANQKDCYGTP